MVDAASPIRENLGKAFDHTKIAAGEAYTGIRGSLHGFSGKVQSAIKDGRVLEASKNFAGRHPLKITAAIVATAALGVAHHSRAVARREADEQSRGRD